MNWWKTKENCQPRNEEQLPTWLENPKDLWTESLTELKSSKAMDILVYNELQHILAELEDDKSRLKLHIPSLLEKGCIDNQK